MHKDSITRFANGIVSTLLLCFFVVHGGLGSAYALGAVGNGLAWLAWVGAALAVCHIVLCIATSKSMLEDTVRPPSDKKKRHLALKWATGAVLAVALAAHIACTTRGGGPSATANPTGLAVTIVLVAAIASHLCIGAKSLLKDMRLAKSLRTPLRAAVIIVAVVYGILCLASVL